MTRRFRFAAVAVLIVASASCSADTVTAERAPAPPTPVPAEPLPARAVDGFAPSVDDRVAVVGVPIGEHLEMRALPGIEQPIVANIPGTETELFGFGQTVESDDGRTWWLVRWRNAQGWIEPGAAYVGAERDVGALVAGSLPLSAYPSADALAQAVADYLGSTTVVVEQLVEGTTSQTILDVIDDGNTALGRRVTLSGESDGTQWRPTAIVETPLCRRGVDSEGACIG